MHLISFTHKRSYSCSSTLEERSCSFRIFAFEGPAKAARLSGLAAGRVRKSPESLKERYSDQMDYVHARERDYFDKCVFS